MKNHLGRSNLANDWLRGFGKRVRQIRRSLKLNQGDLASQAGLSSANSLTRMECGIAGRLNFELILRLLDLARQAGYDANWLFGGERRGAERMRDYDWLYRANRVDVEREANNLEWAATILRQVAQRKDLPEDLGKFLSDLSQGAFQRPAE